ncbi:MAG: PAS domain S-box protein [Chlorobiaceae bacterium]|nr:PAS domain S-box protein [Chlorobiaceae bacterium]
MKKSNAISAHLTELRKEAETLLSAGKRKYPDFAHSHEEMQRVVHELAVHQIELEMQQDELLQTRAELEESLECYTELYELAPLGYLTLTENGTIRQVNLTATKLLGVERSKLIGDRFGRFVEPEDLSVFNALLLDVFSQPKSRSCELLLMSDDNHPIASKDPFTSHTDEYEHDNRTVRIDAILSQDGKECRVVVSDITMQKRVEREKNALLSKLKHAGKSESKSDSFSDFNHNQIDKVIHARIRFAALSYLYTANEASFVQIKKQIKTTDGNLSVHMRMLESADYIKCDKDLLARKPQTIYKITPKGHDAFVRYKACITAFLGT